MVIRYAGPTLWCIALAVCSPAFAAEAPRAKGVVVEAKWLKKPSAEDIAYAYPPLAATAGIEGRVFLTCTVGTDTKVSNCKVNSENPPAFGFGDAAISLAAEFRLSPKTVNGVPEASEVHIPISFRPDLSEAQAVSAPSLADAIAKDPEATKDAREIARKLSQLDPTFQGLSTSYRQYLSRLFADGSGKPPPQIVSAFTASLADLTAERQDRVAASLVMDLTPAQLKDIRAFLETASGSAFSAKIVTAMLRSTRNDQELLIAFVDAWRTKACAPKACNASQAQLFSWIRVTFAKPSDHQDEGPMVSEITASPKSDH